MEVNAAFVDVIYDAVKAHETYQSDFSGKPIVIVLDIAPAHRQTEGLVRQHSDLVLLRLGPYSPMCNPIEGKTWPSACCYCSLTLYDVLCLGCFSVLKAKIKSYLALSHDEMLDVPRGQMQELHMQLLEKAAEHFMPCMSVRLVNRMARHCAHAVAAAQRSEPMEYGK
ncbi:hypothetical protein PI126_g2576 [Phytophthora idaei]|nr:hypothetical protein PI126_g2576 [Phytophthora idaei]